MPPLEAMGPKWPELDELIEAGEMAECLTEFLSDGSLTELAAEVREELDGAGYHESELAAWSRILAARRARILAGVFGVACLSLERESWQEGAGTEPRYAARIIATEPWLHGFLRRHVQRVEEANGWTPEEESLRRLLLQADLLRWETSHG